MESQSQSLNRTKDLSVFCLNPQMPTFVSTLRKPNEYFVSFLQCLAEDPRIDRLVAGARLWVSYFNVQSMLHSFSPYLLSKLYGPAVDQALRIKLRATGMSFRYEGHKSSLHLLSLGWRVAEQARTRNNNIWRYEWFYWEILLSFGFRSTKPSIFSPNIQLSDFDTIQVDRLGPSAISILSPSLVVIFNLILIYKMGTITFLLESQRYCKHCQCPL